MVLGFWDIFKLKCEISIFFSSIISVFVLFVVNILLFIRSLMLLQFGP